MGLHPFADFPFSPIIYLFLTYSFSRLIFLTGKVVFPALGRRQYWSSISIGNEKFPPFLFSRGKSSESDHLIFSLKGGKKKEFVPRNVLLTFNATFKRKKFSPRIVRNWLLLWGEVRGIVYIFKSNLILFSNIILLHKNGRNL